MTAGLAATGGRDAVDPVSAAPLVSVRDLSKTFGGVRAVREVSLDILPGTVHALVGENGAGKSTVGKMIAGMHPPSGGRILLEGEEVSFASPREALQHGIAMIDQEIALVPSLSVLDNIFLGDESRTAGFLSPRRMRTRFDELLERTGFSFSPSVAVGDLSVVAQQQVEIVRALARGSRLVVMDEPTARLTASEAESFYDIVRSLKRGGTAVIYVSHFLSEVLDLADTVTIMRDGRLVRTGPIAEETEQTLITGMLGREQSAQFPDPVLADPTAPPRLQVRGLTGKGFRDVDLEIRPGEIVGLIGLVGAGRSEFATALVGVDRHTAGTVAIDGEEVRIQNPRQAIAHGLTMLPEDRKDQGLVLMRSIRENITLSRLAAVSTLGWVSPGVERRAVEHYMTDLSIRATGTDVPVDNLSGGNQQKVLFAKQLFVDPRILVIDEPTRGVDIGAKRAIYELIVQLAAEGMAVLVISSEMEEVLGLSHRILVMARGRIRAELDRESATEELILESAFA